MRLYYYFRMLFILFTMTVLTNNVFSAEVLDKGEVAPYKGVIFTVKEEQNLRANNEKRLKLEDLRITYENKMFAQERKIVLQNDRINLLRDGLKDSAKLSTWGKFGYFMVGFISSGVIFYYSAKAINHLN